MSLGFLRDTLGLAMASLVALTGALFLALPDRNGSGSRLSRSYLAFSFSTTGVALTWLALTPWLALVGMALAILGGFLVFGDCWGSEGEAALAVRFGWERTWGIVLALLGLCILSDGRPGLVFLDAPTSDLSWALQSPGMGSGVLGAGFLFFGLMIQMQPFPLLGWVMKESLIPCIGRIVLSQVFTAWAAFALLLRFESQFRAVGIFPAVGWFAFISTILTAAAGTFSHSWRVMLSAWTAAGFSTAVAVLAFVGPAPAFVWLLGVGLGASALSGLGAFLEGSSKGNRKAIYWAKAGCVLAAACGTGVFGFVAAGGGVRWFTLIWEQPSLALVSAIAFFFFSFIGWKAGWAVISNRAPEKGSASPGLLIAPYALIILGLGLVWTGAFSGGSLTPAPDHVFYSLLGKIFGTLTEVAGDDRKFLAATFLYWLCLIVSAFASYWTVARRVDFWPSISRTFPKTAVFLSSGYFLDQVAKRALSGLVWLGQSEVWLVDQRRWSDRIARVLTNGLKRSAVFLAKVDALLSQRIAVIITAPVNAGSKFLQWLQSGDVQWYLLFSVGSGIVMLAYFFRI
jgi:hypothetical protein